MTGNGLHDIGEEYFQRQALNTGDITTTTARIGLYLDDEDEGGDNLDESDTINDITTEPDDGEYSRKEIQLDSDDIEMDYSSGDTIANVRPVDINTEDTTGDIDSWFIVIEFESEIAEDSEPNQHLIMSGRLDVSEPEPLDNLNVARVSGISGRLK